MNRCELSIEGIALKGPRSLMLCALLLGFGSGACAGDESDESVTPPLPTARPRAPDVGRVPSPPVPPVDSAGQCAAEVEKPCKRLSIPLDGNPKDDPALRAKYMAAFDPACYLSEEGSFGCFYRFIKKACADAKQIGTVSGNAPYDPKYECQPVGNGDYTLQIGPDSANKLFIYLVDAPRQSPLIDINGVPTAVNGPYRNLPEPQVLGPGEDFYEDTVDKNGSKIQQKQLILTVNSDAHGGETHSDLAGFEYPCDGPDKPLCKEPLVLQVARPYDDDAAQVHHVIRKKDQRCCAWGTNSNTNAAVISRRLNRYLYYYYPTATEVLQINQATAYSP